MSEDKPYIETHYGILARVGMKVVEGDEFNYRLRRKGGHIVELGHRVGVHWPRYQRTLYYHPTSLIYFDDAGKLIWPRPEGL